MVGVPKTRATCVRPPPTSAKKVTLSVTSYSARSNSDWSATCDHSQAWLRLRLALGADGTATPAATSNGRDGALNCSSWATKSSELRKRLPR